MELIFVCPKTNKVFKSADYTILDNKGVKKDESGNKILDAKVEPVAPCPFCGKHHVYQACELPCPFTIKNRSY